MSSGSTKEPSAESPPKTGRRKPDKPTPLDPSSLLDLCSASTPPESKRVRKEGSGVGSSLSQSHHSSTTPQSPGVGLAQSTRAHSQISVSSSPSHSLDSPRQLPLKSPAFNELHKRAEDSQEVRLLVLQIEREMRSEIDRLKATHLLEVEKAAEQFNALVELLQRKREEWSLQMAAKETCIADLQNDLIGLVKSEREAQVKMERIACELEKGQLENARLRHFIADQSLNEKKEEEEEPKASSSNGSGSERLQKAVSINDDQLPGPSAQPSEKKKRVK